jgi:uncharacterized protein YqeY
MLNAECTMLKFGIRHSAFGIRHSAFGIRHSAFGIEKMTLSDKVSSDIISAMKAKETVRLSALRMLKTAIVNKSVEKGRDLEDGEVLQVVSSLVKQRRDSIDQFAKAGRTDLVEKEAAEISVLDLYLPPAASAEEIDAAVTAAIAETGAASAKDMGKVMKAVMPKLAGKNADGKAVNDAVRRKLG